MADISPERQAKIELLVGRYRQRLTEEWPEGEADATQIEELVLRIERELLREVTEVLIQEQSGKRLGNRATCPKCGRLARYTCQSALPLVTLFGRVRAERAYFYCGQCRDGFCPQDAAWGIGPGGATPGVQSLTGYLASHEAYTQVPQTVRRVRPQAYVGITTVEEIAQALGARLEAAPPRLATPATRCLVAAVDGVMLPVRGGNKEARCGMIYEPDFVAGRTPEDCAGLQKEYVGTLESREALVREVCHRVELRRPTPKTKVGAMGDGAHWIWEQYAALLPHREEILDLRHALEHLGAVAAVRFPEVAAREQWLASEKLSLLTVGPELLISGLLLWEPGTAAAQTVRERELGYFQNNRARMDYPRYLAAGWPIATGAIEGACKHLITGRFKRSGMTWKLGTAEPLIHLRAALLTDPDLDLRPYAYAT